MHRSVAQGGAEPARTRDRRRAWTLSLLCEMSGVRDETIIDLPFTWVSQAYFLMHMMGEDEVSLHGEADGSSDKIKRLNPDSFLNDSRDYDLIVNVDSLTEMDRATAQRYVDKIDLSVSRFWSINHEAMNLR